MLRNDLKCYIEIVRVLVYYEMHTQIQRFDRLRMRYKNPNRKRLCKNNTNCEKIHLRN